MSHEFAVDLRPYFEPCESLTIRGRERVKAVGSTTCFTFGSVGGTWVGALVATDDDRVERHALGDDLSGGLTVLFVLAGQVAMNDITATAGGVLVVPEWRSWGRSVLRLAVGTTLLLAHVRGFSAPEPRRRLFLQLDEHLDFPAFRHGSVVGTRMVHPGRSYHDVFPAGRDTKKASPVSFGLFPAGNVSHDPPAGARVAFLIEGMMTDYGVALYPTAIILDEPRSAQDQRCESDVVGLLVHG